MHQLFGWVFRRLLLIDVLIGMPGCPSLPAAGHAYLLELTARQCTVLSASSCTDHSYF